MPLSASARQAKPKIIVLYNEHPDWLPGDKEWVEENVASMRAGLSEQRYEYVEIKFFDDLSALDRHDPREWMIWNWGEELAGQPWSEALVAEELERRGFAYTGSPPAAFRNAQNRMRVKEQLRSAGLPTLPACVYTQPEQAVDWQHYPAIVKGLNQHASYGIGRNSVVADAGALERQVAWLKFELDDQALVEPFLDTREFHVAVWGNQQPEALPPVELDYGVFDDMRDRLYTYDWKFERHSRGFKEIAMRCPAPVDRPDWRARLEQVAIQAYRALELRDYGRIDLRMLGDEPQILDVNPNPDLDLTSVLPVSTRALGLTFGQMVDRIVRYAAARTGREHSPSAASRP